MSWIRCSDAPGTEFETVALYTDVFLHCARPCIKMEKTFFAAFDSFIQYMCTGQNRKVTFFTQFFWLLVKYLFNYYYLFLFVLCDSENTLFICVKFLDSDDCNDTQCGLQPSGRELLGLQPFCICLRATHVIQYLNLILTTIQTALVV